MILEDIDRTIFEVLRLAVVDAGYLPDITAYGSISAYAAAKDALRASLPDQQLIEIAGVGAPDTREIKSVCKIVIDRAGYAKGGLGAFPSTRFEKVGNTFTKYILPDESKDVRYNIRITSQSSKFDRILNDIIENALGGRGYFKAIDSNGILTGDPFLVDQISMIDVTATNILEKLFVYQVPDVWIQRPKVLIANIAPMTTITGEYYFQNDSLHVDMTVTGTLDSSGSS